MLYSDEGRSFRLHFASRVLPVELDKALEEAASQDVIAIDA